MSKELGKITSVEYGFGGYQDVQFGVTFVLGGEAWGTTDFWGVWADRIESAKWTLEERAAELGAINDRLRDLLRAAKVERLSQLAGKPIETIFGEDGRLVSWRVLTEVL